jgi:hypothetical protein
VDHRGGGPTAQNRGPLRPTATSRLHIADRSRPRSGRLRRGGGQAASGGGPDLGAGVGAGLREAAAGLGVLAAVVEEPAEGHGGGADVH